MRTFKNKFKYIKYGIIIFIIIPIMPYKLIGKDINSNYIELGVYCAQSSGGQVVLSGGDKIINYSKKNGYYNINDMEVNLVGLNIHKTIKDSALIEHLRFRVYGEFINNVDEYNVISFDVKEWYPLDGYIPICNTKIWEKFSLIYNLFFLIYILFLSIYHIIMKKKL